jgi:hypothetical protein
MSDNNVDYSINGDTNAEDVANRVKKSTTSIESQVQGVGNKFKMAFKDIFLSVLGPMAIFGTVLALISRSIEESKKKTEEANQAAIDGTNDLMSAEDRYWANKQNNEKKSKETKEQAKLTREEVTAEFLRSGDPRANALYAEELRARPIGPAERVWSMARTKEIQDKVQGYIAEDMKKNPEALAPSERSFKAPEGFSNVVGVGANPVLEAMTAQLEEQKKQTELLQQIANGTPPKDFTK